MSSALESSDHVICNFESFTNLNALRYICVFSDRVVQLVQSLFREIFMALTAWSGFLSSCGHLHRSQFAKLFVQVWFFFIQIFSAMDRAHSKPTICIKDWPWRDKFCYNTDFPLLEARPYVIFDQQLE